MLVPFLDLQAFNCKREKVESEEGTDRHSVERVKLYEICYFLFLEWQYSMIH